MGGRWLCTAMGAVGTETGLDQDKAEEMHSKKKEKEGGMSSLPCQVSRLVGH